MAQVRAITMGMDSQRAIIGCEDARALIFDMHSGRLIRSLPPNPGPVTALFVMENDDFLITAGKFRLHHILVPTKPIFFLLLSFSDPNSPQVATK